ncbi:MAG: site-specific integrase [Dehalococcoidia bacterium]|nr:site-specific integrase [Dehalococcoidia bacterium]
MRGHIRRRGKGSWEVTVRLGRDPITRRYRRRFLTVKGTKRDAERALAEALHQRDTGVDIAPGKLTNAEYLRRWLRDYVSHNCAPSTVIRYTGIIERHLIPRIGALLLRDLRPAHIQAAYGEALAAGGRLDAKPVPLSPRTVLQHHRVLKEALSHAVEWQLITRNPADAVRPPHFRRRELRVLSLDETLCLLEVAQGSPYYVLIYLALATGARLGELLALRWSDLDLDSGTMRITRTAVRLPGVGVVFSTPKTQRAVRPVALSRDTVDVLRRRRLAQLETRLTLGPAYEDQDLVFAWATGRPQDRGAVRRELQKLAAKAGFEGLRFHDLRHTAATLMLAAGVNPKVASERLGHATVAFTLDTYSHVLPNMQRQAAEAMDRLLGRPAGRPATGS